MQTLTVSQLNAMTIKDLVALNKQIVAIVKEKQRTDNRTASFNFMPGDRVSYDRVAGARMFGTVLQVKRTKVVVETNLGRYLVPASMLKAA